MKKKIISTATFFVMLCAVFQAYSQAPQLLNYQGVARNGTEILHDKTIELQFTVHDLTTGGTPLYSETQSVSTNAYGIFTAKIGNGTVVSGSFNAITWSSHAKYLEVDIDTTNTGNFSTLATTQLLSVPYALYANQSDTADFARNAPQATYLAGHGISITGNTINTDTIGLSPTTSGDSLIISQGTHVIGYVGLSLLVPPGTIQAYGGSTAPAGWLLCDGQSYSTTQYPALYSAISFNFGGSGVSFNVPDFRGRFLRGVDGTAGNDPDKASRTAMNTNGAIGNNVGSIEGDAFANHTHQCSIPNAAVSAALNSQTGVGASNGYATITTTSAGGSETRPKNAYVNYIIKY